MTYIPEPDPTPLRMRLGPRAEGWQPPADDEIPETEDTLAPDVEDHAHIDITMPADVVAHAVTAQPAPNVSWSERLDQAVAETDRRVERWVADQQRRLVAGLDLMLAQLKEQRQEEARRLEAWKVAQRERVERELAQEEERFRARLMSELTAFEEQLGLRLIEQEERLARWWDEAERLAAQRFSDLGLSPTKEPTAP